MRYRALALDYDGTVAEEGKVSPETAAALWQIKRSGRSVLLVTGRVLPELRECFDQLEVFDRIVAENGALLYRPEGEVETLLNEPPKPEFAKLLRERGVGPISLGKVITATWEPHQNVVLETIRELGLELEVIFNKGAVMILPTGVNKGSGLRAALKELDLKPEEAVGVGDAENDHSLLRSCGLGVAVANALPSLKERADWVVTGARGAGVRQVIEGLLRNDLADIPVRPG
jgi:hydroxymethylpyrimidine pyrophosphatase-like HAD family hydrolase